MGVIHGKDPWTSVSGQACCDNKFYTNKCVDNLCTEFVFISSQTQQKHRENLCLMFQCNLNKTASNQIYISNATPLITIQRLILPTNRDTVTSTPTKGHF